MSRGYGVTQLSVLQRLADPWWFGREPRFFWVPLSDDYDTPSARRSRHRAAKSLAEDGLVTLGRGPSYMEYRSETWEKAGVLVRKEILWGRLPLDTPLPFSIPAPILVEFDLARRIWDDHRLRARDFDTFLVEANAARDRIRRESVRWRDAVQPSLRIEVGYALWAASITSEQPRGSETTWSIVSWLPRPSGQGDHPRP